MKGDFELSDKITEVSCMATKCKQMLCDLIDTIDTKDEKMFVYQHDRIYNYTDIACDYICEIDKKLDRLCDEMELINENKKAPAPTKAQGA